MKVIKNKEKKKDKIYSIKIDKKLYDKIKIIKENGIDLPEMLRKFIEKIYNEIEMNVDDNTYFNK
jgi:asparagine synthetase A